ncbi:hypothetical protein HZS_6037 [Henneguya salminicola]|uniref:Diphthine--ammonia ligase n=1 Tax=Henneguya salminicola TaxID=69463 RepID=A0A6G3MHR9_HENSL|nr:hypothetical protein HZS_6037 [Henneguya salminicola]
MAVTPVHCFIGLISGGKDSIFAISKLVSMGHELVCLANLYPINHEEIDSYMFQSVGSEVLARFDEIIGVPIYRMPINGCPLSTSLEYQYTKGDEIEDLFNLLANIKNRHSNITSVSCGAIGSKYQSNRLHNICKRLNICPLCPLWGKDEAVILRDMIDFGLEAITVKIACAGLTSNYLSHSINDKFYNKMLDLKFLYNAHICGEGGEYETLVIYCPGLYKKRINIKDSNIVVLKDDKLAPVLILKIFDFSLEIP